MGPREWRCLRQKKNATPAQARTAIPPTTPPTMGPGLVPDDDDVALASLDAVESEPALVFVAVVD